MKNFIFSGVAWVLIVVAVIILGICAVKILIAYRTNGGFVNALKEFAGGVILAACIGALALAPAFAAGWFTEVKNTTPIVYVPPVGS